MRTMTRRIGFALLVVSAAALGGCGYTQRQKAQRIEPMLSAAGFKMKLADTPEKLAKIQAMPQLKLQPVKRQGKLYFAYPDVQGCTCLYLGNQTAYQNYQNLVLERREVKEEKEAAIVNEDAAIIDDDAVWESWGFDVW